MKKQIFTIVFLFVFMNTFCQVKPCPEKNQDNYSCGQIEENILDRMPKTEDKIKTLFTARLTNSFRKKNDQKRAEKILALCNQVLNDTDFWNALEKYDKYRYSVFEGESGLQEVAGIQIVNCLINGSPDNFSRPEIMEIPLHIELYGASFRVPLESALGKEEGDGKIYNKKWFFRNYSIDNVGSNWIHEFSHSKGLKHCYKCDSDRDYSIPYVINRVFVEVAEKYMIQY